MKPSPWPATFGLIAIAFLLFAPVHPVWAQTPSPTDPVGILEWLKLQGVTISLIVTMLWKYVPVVKDWSNLALPWLVLTGWVVAQLAGVPIANAADGVAVAKVSWLHAVAIGVFNSQVSKVLWDGWLKPTVGAWLDDKLGRKPQTP